MTLAELGEAFRHARIAANKTQQQVADETGTARSRISMLETGVLPELGMVKLLSLFESVGIELFARPMGHGRTLDDVLREEAESAAMNVNTRVRVRHGRRKFPHPPGVAEPSASEHYPATAGFKKGVQDE